MSELTFGERLADLRAARKMTQEELGTAIGMKQQTIGSYETNTAFPSKDVLLRLCNLFQVSLDYLVARTDYDLRDEGLERTFLIHNGRTISTGKMLELLTSLDDESKKEAYEIFVALLKGGKLKQNK